MIYELRVYHCVPGRLPDLLKRFDTITLKLWDKHGIRQAGFWTTLVGESNQDLTYLLQWESLAEREKKFGAFGADPDWLKPRAQTEKNGQIVASITNTLLAPTSFSSVQYLDLSGKRHDLRIARLPRRPGPSARSVEALRLDHAQDLAAPRHRASRLLDNAGRRVEPGALLPIEMGVARRAREEVEHASGRSGMASPARRDRSKRPDRAACRELVPGADQLLLGEVDFSQRGDETRRIKKPDRPGESRDQPIRRKSA